MKQFKVSRRLLNQALLSLPPAHVVLAVKDMPRRMVVPIYKPDFAILEDHYRDVEAAPYHELVFNFDIEEMDWICENVKFEN
jgi:hypothetical protein